MEQPLILASARRHGVADEAILHAYDHPLFVIDQEDDITMIIGLDHSGTMIEVGVVDTLDGPVIVHAMRPARRKYQR